MKEFVENKNYYYFVLEHMQVLELNWLVLILTTTANYY
jgi:hypothetical protein